MILGDARAHFEHAQVIRRDIKPRSVERSKKLDDFRKNPKGIPLGHTF
jgi:hypothetical protein